MTKLLETLRSFPMGFNRVKDAVSQEPERVAEGRQASPLPLLRKVFLAAVAVLMAADTADAGVFERKTGRKMYIEHGHVSIDSDVPGQGAFHITLPHDTGQQFYFPRMQSKMREVMTEYHWATPEAAQFYYCNPGLNITEIHNPDTYIPKPSSFTTRSLREEQPKIYFQEEPICPPKPTSLNELLPYHYINGLRVPVPMKNEEWEALEEEARLKNEKAYKQWEESLRKGNVRVRGDAETPRGYRVIVIQQVLKDTQRNAYIIDKDSGSIWREK